MPIRPQRRLRVDALTYRIVVIADSIAAQSSSMVSFTATSVLPMGIGLSWASGDVAYPFQHFKALHAELAQEGVARQTGDDGASQLRFQ